MKIEGTASLSHSPEKVFAALTDPAVLTKTLPGCQSLEQVGPDIYKMVITAGVASIKGSYLGQVELSDRLAPTSFTMRAAGSGAPGTIQAVVKMSLTSEGEGTLLSYDADAVVGGVIAGVGQRVLGGVAKKTAGEFFKSIDRYLAGDTRTAADVSNLAHSSPPSQTSQSRLVSNPPSVTQRRIVEAQTGSLTFLTVGAGIALIGVVVGWLISH
jgi:carbon monoxide dehydrogenase subunit G